MRDSVGRLTVGLKHAHPSDPSIVGPGLSWHRVARYEADGVTTIVETTRSVVFDTHAADGADGADAATWVRVAPGLSRRRIMWEDADGVHVTQEIQVDGRALSVAAAATALACGAAAAVCRRSGE